MGHRSIKTPFWFALTDRHREELQRLGRLQTFQADAVILRQNDLSDHVLVVLQGCVKATAHGSTGYQAVLALRDPGDLVGEMASMDGCPRSATLRALTDVQVLVVSAKSFCSFLKSWPDAEAAMRRTMSARLREADRYRTSAGANTVPQRLALLLLDLGRRYGVPDGAGGTLIELPLSQHDLAGLILTSHRTLARVLERWRERGWVVTGRRSVLLKQPAALRRAAS
jgi:CRP/FNR family transcriptional regulator, cyclic AMP receptor protein